MFCRGFHEVNQLLVLSASAKHIRMTLCGYTTNGFTQALLHPRRSFFIFDPVIQLSLMFHVGPWRFKQHTKVK